MLRFGRRVGRSIQAKSERPSTSSRESARATASCKTQPEQLTRDSPAFPGGDTPRGPVFSYQRSYSGLAEKQINHPAAADVHGAGSAVGQDIAVVAACILKSIGQDGKAVEYLAGQAGRPVPSVIVVVPVPVTTNVVRGPGGPTSATGPPPTLGCSDAAEW